MFTGQQTKIQRSMRCSMCQNVYKDPRILPCGHTFCLTCLSNQAKFVYKAYSTSKLPECVRCQKSWPTPATDQLKNEAVASLCDDLSAVLNVNLMEGSLIEQESNRACSLHSDEKRKYFCKICSEFACPTCIIKLHRTHDYEEIKVYCFELDQVLKKTQDEHKANVTALRREIANLQARLNEEVSVVISYDELLSGNVTLSDKIEAAKDTKAFSDKCRSRLLLPLKLGTGYNPLRALEAETRANNPWIAEGGYNSLAAEERATIDLVTQKNSDPVTYVKEEPTTKRDDIKINIVEQEQLEPERESTNVDSSDMDTASRSFHDEDDATIAYNEYADGDNEQPEYRFKFEATSSVGSPFHRGHSFSSSSKQSRPLTTPHTWPRSQTRPPSGASANDYSKTTASKDRISLIPVHVSGEKTSEESDQLVSIPRNDAKRSFNIFKKRRATKSNSMNNVQHQVRDIAKSTTDLPLAEEHDSTT